eukprot:1800970-Pyramimonas_sp.AAC.1
MDVVFYASLDSADMDPGAPDLVERSVEVAAGAGNVDTGPAGDAQPAVARPAPEPPAPNFVEPDEATRDMNACINLSRSQGL